MIISVHLIAEDVYCDAFSFIWTLNHVFECFADLHSFLDVVSRIGISFAFFLLQIKACQKMINDDVFSVLKPDKLKMLTLPFFVFA